MSAKSIHVNRTQYLSQNLWAGILFGFGLVAFIDEAVFHQLLHWHHFYDLSTPDWGLIWDGIFHAFSWFSTVISSFLLADLHRKKGYWFSRWLGGLFIGGGGFQLYDGIIQHKMMRIHQIRYNVDIMPYDIVWNVIAAGMIVAGIILYYRTKQGAKLARGET